MRTLFVNIKMCVSRVSREVRCRVSREVRSF